MAAGAAHAAVWVIPATGRAFPGTPPGAVQTIAIDAAQNEYEGAQVVLRDGGDHAVSFSWSADSAPLIVANTALDQVFYVNVTQPTTSLRRRAGLYPDPLVPRNFDSQIAVPKTGAEYRSTSVVLGRLEADGGRQLELFADGARKEKMERLAATVDAVNAQFGKHKVSLGTALQLDRHIRTDRDHRPWRKTSLLAGETARQRLNIPRWAVSV